MLDKKFINFRPFLFCAVCLALGIGSGYAFYISKVLLGVTLELICLLFVCFVILFSGENIKKKLIFGVIFILISTFGALALCYQLNDYDNANLEGHYYHVNGKVASVSETDYGQILTLERVNIAGNRTGKLRYGVMLLVYNGEGENNKANFDIGDILEFDGVLQDMGVIYEDKISASYIENKIKYVVNVSLESVTKTATEVAIFERIHLFLRDTIKSGMGEKEGAVAYGLLLGNTDDIDESVINSYRSAGVAHIFAVSGLHIGFLATALNFIFNKLRVNRLLKAIVITLILFFYSGVCGFSASSIRASVMCAVMLFSSINGNRYDGLSSVGIACVLLLICSPINMFCVGFQLSFVVVLGIILLSPPLTKLLSFLPQKLANSLATVVSAQVVGLPICLYAFGKFSTVAIVANLVFIPIVSVIFIFLFVATLVGGIFAIQRVTLFIPNYIFGAINGVITAIDYDIFLVGGFTFGTFVIFYYLALVIPSGIINLKSLTKFILSALCVIVCAVGTIVVNVNEHNAIKAFVVGDERACVTIIKNQEENILIVSDADKYFSLSKLKRLSQRQNLTDLDAVIFTEGNEDIPLVLTRINEVFSFENVYYYGLTDKLLEQTLKISFDASVRSFMTGEYLPIETNIRYMLNGYVVECKINGKDVAIFSELGSNYAGYKGLDESYELIIATDYEQFINEEYKPKELISYKNGLTFKNALYNGTLTLRLK